MDFKQLEYFVRVAEMGGFTRAASMLEVTQPALSHQIRQLEVELRQSLLYRHGRGVALTESGKSLLTHAREILAHVKRAEDELTRGKGSPAGHVTVGLPTGVARRLTLPMMERFRRCYPDASCTIKEGLSVDLVEGVVTGRIDIAMVYNAVPSPSIEIAPLAELEMFLIAPRRTRGLVASIAMSELPEYPLIAPTRPNANRAWIELELTHHGLKPNIALEIDGIVPTLELVLGGFGYAILPVFLLWAHGFSTRLWGVPIVQPTPIMHMALVTSAHRPATQLMRQVLSYLHEAGTKLLAKGTRSRSVRRARKSAITREAARAPVVTADLTMR